MSWTIRARRCGALYRGSKGIRIEAGEYSTVREIDPDQNLLTVERSDSERLTYDPRRLHGVMVYKDEARDIAEGDRIQFTAPYAAERVSNRELGSVEQIDSKGHLKIRLDSGREIQFAVREHPHLDYGYAVTSHSSQGLTADRVLVHVDTDPAHENLINSRLAYVSVSRARDDAQIFTNDAARLRDAFSREVSKASALEFETSGGTNREDQQPHQEPRTSHKSAQAQVERGQAHRHSMGF